MRCEINRFHFQQAIGYLAIVTNKHKERSFILEFQVTNLMLSYFVWIISIIIATKQKVGLL